VLIDHRVDEVHVVAVEGGQVDQRGAALDGDALVKVLDPVGKTRRVVHWCSPEKGACYAP
jgi:hypothetical protein